MKFLIRFSIVVLIALIGIVVYVCPNLKDRNPGYKVDLKVINKSSTVLNAGFSAEKITPEVPDSWNDKNGNSKYNPNDGDTFTDGNRNNKFDPVWIAGFSNNKPATGIHDDLWARTMVFDDGKSRIAIVALDAIGFMNDDVIDVRNLIPAAAGITYTIVSSTHNHEGPDFLGLWGESPFKSGVNKEYLEFVKKQIVKSIVDAAEKMRPAVLSVSTDLKGAELLVKDTRKPEVFDSGLRIIKATDKENGTTLGTLISWADHPETLWSNNLLISSDFPHYVREGVEKGIFNGDSLVKPGVGGVSLYLNGAVGGLMTTHPSLPIKDLFTNQIYKKPTFEKTEAQGKQLALLALEAMEKKSEIIENTEISIVARTISLPIKNKMFQLGTAIGILNRGTSGWMNMRSELAVFKIGPLSFATVPGELYPELANGGIESPKGGDFNIDPVEIPVIRDMMTGKYKFILGLANDEIGYIIPKSQWDAEAPFTYGRDNSPYGEENSLGPETATILHNNLKEMLNELEPSD